jgi:hypothetical protein
MENNMDEVLTASLKNRLNNMKNQATKNSSFAEVFALLTFAVSKYALLSLLIWWGWNTLSEISVVPSLSYWQIVSITVCFRSIGMVLIDPIFSNLSKPEKTK